MHHTTQVSGLLLLLCWDLGFLTNLPASQKKELMPFVFFQDLSPGSSGMRWWASFFQAYISLGTTFNSGPRSCSMAG